MFVSYFEKIDPGVPMNLTVESVKPTSVLISWKETDSPNGVILSYTVAYRQVKWHLEYDA